MRHAPGDAYRAYIPELDRVFVSKDVTFIENFYRNPRKIELEIEASANATEKMRVENEFEIKSNVTENGIRQEMSS